MRKVLAFTIVSFLASLLIPTRLLACTCITPGGYYESIKNNSIILHILVTDVDFTWEKEQAEYSLTGILTQTIEYDLLDNISQSEFPAEKLLHKKYFSLEVYERGVWDCTCGHFVSSDFNLASTLSTEATYVVFANFNNSTGDLEIGAAIQTWGTDEVLGDFGSIASWHNYDEMRAELARDDENVYRLDPSTRLERDLASRPYRIAYLVVGTVGAVGMLLVLISTFLQKRPRRVKLAVVLFLLIYMTVFFGFLVHVMWMDAYVYSQPWFV